VQKRADGTPLLSNGRQVEVSLAHADDLTLVVTGAGPVGCDLAPVHARSAALWQDVLGPERFQLATLLASETGEDLDTAATRVRAASASVKQAGALLTAPLGLRTATADHWVVLASGAIRIATAVIAIQGLPGRLVCAVLDATEGPLAG
jgi:enediyne polyketide synthase